MNVLYLKGEYYFMEVNKQDLEGNKVELQVEVEPERVNDALDKAYKKVVKDVDIPGFRKGKVPRKVLEARYGKEILHKDALDFLIPKAYREAVKAAEIEPIDQPDIEDFYIAEDEPATFTAEIEVKPEVELGEYQELGIEKEESEVTEEDIETRIDQLREQHSQLITSEKSEVEDGDYVIIDYEGKINGETFPGGSAEEFSLEIGSGTFIPGFEEKLIGKKVGEESDISVPFPEDYNAEDLAGEEAVFTVKVKEIKEKKLPELDDDFAREAGDFETFAELKEDITQKIDEEKENKVENEFKNAVVEEAVDNAEVDVPDTLVENELDQMFQNMSYSISQQGLEVDKYLEYMGLNEEEWREKNRENAARMAKNNLVLEAIAREEGIEVSDEELDNKVEEIAAESDQDLEQVKVIMQMQGQLAKIKEGLRVEKTLDFLLENN